MSGISADQTLDNGVVPKIFLDEGNGNFAFIRVFNYNSDGTIISVSDYDLNGSSYAVTGPVVQQSISLDHGSLSGLGDDDHFQYHNDIRGDIRYYTKTQTDALIDIDVAAHANLINNPHNVTKAQIGLGNADNTSDADKPISTATQTALDLKYDASNPNGYETPAQLNARDTANRDRANHTGTQLASTISDFTTAVQTAETTTSLQIIGNTLRYTNEDGVQQDIDLTIYLDDTNLARLVSGVLNPLTGIITFTRDDSTTFNIDASALLDDQNASEVPVTPSGNLTSTNVQAALVEHQGDIDSLALADTNLQSQITSNDSDISALQAEQITQNNDITQNASDIAQNASDIASNDTDIANLQAEQVTQNTSIATNQSNISSLQASQSTQDTAIALNTAKVSADGSIDTHSDVDTTTAPPNNDDQLCWNGSNWVPKSIENGFTIFPIWAEESGGLSNNNAQWSFGNGAVGFIGIPLALDCELFAISLNANVVGTSVSINIQRNGGNVVTPNFTANNQVIPITPAPYSEGDLLTFQTNTEAGNWVNARVCAWFRVKSTALFPTPDRSVVASSNTSFTSGTFATIPGLSTTVTINDTGVVDGMLIYSAARSGFANSEAQFRVVINGINGQVFADTFSTFNDTGGASFVVQNLPAGAYTVLAQCATNNPILIASAQLTAVGIES